MSNGSSNNSGCLVWVIIIVVALVLFGGGSGSSSHNTSTNTNSNKTANTSTNSAKNTNSDSNLVAQSQPVTGTVLSGVETGYSQISVTASSSESAYVKVVDASTGAEQVSFFVRAGETGYTIVPAGSYAVHFAMGSTWYGKSNRFGSNTAYGQDKSCTLQDYEEMTYRLQKTTSGNFSLATLNASQF